MFRITINLVIAFLCLSASLTFLLPWYKHREAARIYLQKGITIPAVILDKSTGSHKGWLPETGENNSGVKLSNYNFLLRFKFQKRVFVYPVTEYVTLNQYKSLKVGDLVEMIYLPDSFSVTEGKISFDEHVLLVESIKSIPTENWSNYWRIYPGWSFAALSLIFILTAFLPVRRAKEESVEILVET